jgi:hypothetical protein
MVVRAVKVPIPTTLQVLDEKKVKVAGFKNNVTGCMRILLFGLVYKFPFTIMGIFAKFK